MLRDGSDVARRGGDGGAAGAAGAAGSVADGVSTEHRAARSLSGSVPAGQVTPDPGRADAPSAGGSGVLSLCRLSGGELAGLGREGLLGVLGDIERMVNQAVGYRAEVLGALDALSRSGAAPDAAPHLSLRDAAGVSERDARRMVRAAAKAREHTGVLGALSQGGINAAQAEALCDARVPDEVRADLVVAAGGEDTDATRRRVRQAEADHSVETSMERFERQRRARGAGWQRDHAGMLRLWAKLDPEVGAAVEANLEALRRQYWLDDKHVRDGRRTPAQRDADVLAYALAGITLTGTDTAAVDRLHARARQDGRTCGAGAAPSERLHDRASQAGLGDDEPARGEDLAIGRQPSPSRRTTPPKRAAAGRTTPSKRAGEQTAAGSEESGCAPPEGQAAHDESTAVGRRLPAAQISVLIGLDTLRGATDEMGLTDAGVELPPEVVRRLACDAEIIPMFLSGPGGPADVGRSRRTVPLRLRRLLIARDRHCRWPGCNQPPSRCDAHHIWHWTDGGPTDLDNLVLLCHTHHHHLHQHGYRMVPQPDGTWTTTQQTEPEPANATRAGAAQPRAP